MTRYLVVLAASILMAGAAAPLPTPQPPDLRVLFIGNSLTAANDLPATVERIARASGWEGAIRCDQVTHPDVSLQDHWEEGDALRAIRRGGWTHVVLQQGPSSLPASQAHLREYTARFAREIRAVGAEIVLYGVWPPRARLAWQPAVTDGYRRAAHDVGGRIVPVGEGWAAAWARDPSLPLYDTDQFHPSAAGTYLAALMFVEALTGRAFDRLPPAARRALPRPPGLDDDRLDALFRGAASAREARPPGRTIAIPGVETLRG